MDKYQKQLEALNRRLRATDKLHPQRTHDRNGLTPYEAERLKEAREARKKRPVNLNPHRY